MDDYGDTSKLEIQPAVTKKDITLISYFFLSFLNKLFKVANERTLTFEDLGTVFYGQPGVLGSLGPVLILSRLVNYLQGVVDYSTSTVWIMVALLFVLPMVSSFALAHSNTTMLGIAAVARNMLVAALYRKSLTISAAKKLEISTGRILTLYSEDSKQILSVVGSLHTAILAPFQIATCLYLIYRQVGVSMFVCLGYSVFVMPVTGVIFEYVFQIRKQKMEQSDIRVKFMNDVLRGIRVVKYYALENAFIKKISAVREKEVHLIRKMGYLYNIPFGILLAGAPNIQTVLIFLTFICIGRELDVSTAFTTITLMGIMAAPFSFLPTGIQAYSQSLVAMDRIMHFLDCEDVAEYINRVEPGTLADSAGHTDVVIQFQDVSVAWSPVASPASSPRTPADKVAAYETVATNSTEENSEIAAIDVNSDGGTSRATHTLVDLNLSIRQGELVGIVGSVGGGHSSLLNAVLGEMNLRCGTLSMVKDLTIAYCDQRPWIMNATVKDNITFGKELDEARLERAIYVCGMKEGLREREGGLDCEIGEHGTNISGGQRARVSLARAVYNDADVYLLDDPLSAMDALVGEHIFQKCIKEELKGKTVLLVTHDLHVLPQCDKIVILDDEGGILRSGTSEQILRSGVDVKKYLIPVEGKNKVKQPQKVEEASVKSTSQRRRPPRRLPQRIPWQEMVDAVKNSEKDGSLTKDEEMNEDGVPWSTYGSFISAGGVLLFVLVVLAQLGGQVLSIYASFWLTNWGANTRTFQSTYQRDMPLSRSLYWYNGYAGTLMASVALVTF
eukprot:gene17357-19780_t